MSSIRTDDAATRAHDKLREEASGTGHAAAAKLQEAGHTGGQAADPGLAAGKKASTDALEAGAASGFKSKWARELESKPAAGAQGAPQESHDQRAREATETQKVSDILKSELQKRV